MKRWKVAIIWLMSVAGGSQTLAYGQSDAEKKFRQIMEEERQRRMSLPSPAYTQKLTELMTLKGYRESLVESQIIKDKRCVAKVPELITDTYGSKQKHGQEWACYQLNLWESSGEWKMGKKHSIWTKWFKNGQPQWQRTYQDGQIIGASMGWHENGVKRRESNYKNGKKHGNALEWHSDGTLVGKWYFENGKAEGQVTEWWPNGNRMQQGNYRNNVKDGKWTIWYADGSIGSETFH